MKVMLVNGSSHEHGTTMMAIEEMIKVFNTEGVETEVIPYPKTERTYCTNFIKHSDNLR